MTHQPSEDINHQKWIILHMGFGSAKRINHRRVLLHLNFNNWETRHMEELELPPHTWFPKIVAVYKEKISTHNDLLALVICCRTRPFPANRLFGTLPKCTNFADSTMDSEPPETTQLEESTTQLITLRPISHSTYHHVLTYLHFSARPRRFPNLKPTKIDSTPRSGTIYKPPHALNFNDPKNLNDPN